MVSRASYLVCVGYGLRSAVLIRPLRNADTCLQVSGPCGRIVYLCGAELKLHPHLTVLRLKLYPHLTMLWLKLHPHLTVLC